MTTASPIGVTSTALELDHVASKYGLYRHEAETLANFKERFLSVFSFPTNNSEVGFAAAIARSLNTYPRIIGYMEVNPEVGISYDGFKLIIDGEEIPYALRNKYLEDLVNDYGAYFTLYLDDEKYLYTLVVYPSDNVESIGISYAQNWKYIPIVYCPVSIFSMTNLINEPLIPFMENGNSFTDTTEELYKDLLWESFTRNNIFWKANQNSPRSEFGTYYGN
jgi:hypothetical protein